MHILIHYVKYQNYLYVLVVYVIRDIISDLMIDIIMSLNDTISGDEKYLGSGYKIGHSYFCPDEEMDNPDDAWYNRIIQFEIEPLLKEYWFDDIDRAENEVENLS